MTVRLGCRLFKGHSAGVTPQRLRTIEHNQAGESVKLFVFPYVVLCLTLNLSDLDMDVVE